MALGGSSSGENKLLSQIPGRVVSIMVKAGDQIKKGDSVIVIESMKMQVAVKAHKDGQVRDTKSKNRRYCIKKRCCGSNRIKEQSFIGYYSNTFCNLHFSY